MATFAANIHKNLKKLVSEKATTFSNIFLAMKSVLSVF